jgi:tetratricopeptide (TPR) repeat protein
VLAAGIVLLITGRAVTAQSAGAGGQQRRTALEAIVKRPLPLRDGIGIAHETVTTSSPRAQAYYDQGLAYLHSYVWIEAARSFNQALALDQNLAMAYMGLSYALGELGLSERSRDASHEASTLANRTTSRERLRIDLREKQLAANARPGDPLLLAEYEKRLELAIAEYPKDVEILLLRGQAMEPRHDAHGMNSGSASLPYYERALAVQPASFATHHYLTHAYENLGRMDRALEHAAVYARMAAVIPHAHHMYGHVLRRVERTMDAIAEFRRADQLEVAYLQAENIPPEYDWHYQHNLDLLATSYEYVGQMQSAEAVLRRSFELPSTLVSEKVNETAWPMFLLARGRADEALAASRALKGRSDPLDRALGHLVASRILMTLDRSDAAVTEGDAALALMRSIGQIGGVLVPELQVTQGELLVRSGQAEKGRALLREGLVKVRARSGPDAWAQSLFSLERVFRVARDLGDWTLATEVTQEMRELEPAYGGSHYSAAQIADHNGDRAGARQEFAKAIEAWRSADPGFPDLADARQRLDALSGPGASRPRGMR